MSSILRRIPYYRIGVLGILFALTAAAIVSPSASAAASGIWSTRDWNCSLVSQSPNGNATKGYFYNGYNSSSSNTSSCWYAPSDPKVLKSGVPSTVWTSGKTYECGNGKGKSGSKYGVKTSGTTQQKLIAFLQCKYYSGDAWMRTGAAFIVRSMFGTKASGSKSAQQSGSLRTISSTAQNNEWEKLLDRLNGQVISYTSSTSSGSRNTQVVSSNGRYDVVQFKQSKNASALLFRSAGSSSNNYVLFTDCANPVGNLPGVPAVPGELVPEVTGSPEAVDGDDAEVSLHPTVSYETPSSGAATSHAADWQLTRFVVPAGQNYNGAGDSTATPTAYFGFGATTLRSGNGTFTAPSADVGVGDYPVGAGHALGTRVCFALSVRPPIRGGNQWRHSAPFCVIIAKKPKAQVWGNDLLVGSGTTGGRVVGSSSTLDISGVRRVFGSWVEYGIIASKHVNTVASGAGYAGGNSSQLFCDVSFLTFTNAGTGAGCTDTTVKGGYATTRGLPAIANRFTNGSAIAGNTIDLAAVSSGVHTSTAAQLSITGNTTTIAKGHWVVIYAPNTAVTIASNVRYTTEQLQTANDIPQVIIIARTITIQGSVGQVDAWLIADSLNTCGDVALDVPLSAAVCNQRLIVNGPVIVDTLYLRRTAGAERSAPGVAAEVFNLRPDAYLWATNRSNASGRLQTVVTKELPPRF